MTKDRKVFNSTGSSSGHGRKRKNSAPNLSLAKLKLRHHTRPGDIGYLIYLHGVVYSKEYGYDRTFEAYVADGLAKFIRSFNPDKDRIWLAERNDQIVGSIAIVRHSEVEAQLRWFFVHPKYRDSAWEKNYSIKRSTSVKNRSIEPCSSGQQAN